MCVHIYLHMDVRKDNIFYSVITVGAIHTHTPTPSLLLPLPPSASMRPCLSLLPSMDGGPGGNTLLGQPWKFNANVSEVSLATRFNTGSECRATKWKGSLFSFWVGRNRGLMCPIFQGMNYRQGSARVPALCGCRMPSLPCLTAY